MVDPLDSGVGTSIESYAKSHGVAVIDYDASPWAEPRVLRELQTTVAVGTLIGQGFRSCVTAWHVKKLRSFVMHGAATDNNATLFAQGYDAVIQPFFKTGKWTDVTQTADTWDPPTAETEFQGLHGSPNINSAVIPNDESAAPIIRTCSPCTSPQDVPDHRSGRDLDGPPKRAFGYQCGTVYKPIYLEAQAASALALYLRPARRLRRAW